MGIFDFLKKGNTRRDNQTTTRNPTVGGTGAVGGAGARTVGGGGSQPLGTQSPNFGNVSTGATTTQQARPDFSNVRTGVSSTAPDARPTAGGSQGVSHQSPGSAGGSGVQSYTVQPGDSLSKISKEFYGNANEYMKIFEANQPLLKDPDKIYPGQVLKIPAR